MIRQPGSSEKSRLIGAALEGSWRQHPPLLRLSAPELEDLAPMLQGSGAAGLVWWKVRDSHMAASAPARGLLDAFRLQALRNAVYECEIEKTYAVFRSAGVEPILLKGFAAARFYAERALRPYGDIDLLVRPGQHALAETLLSRPELHRCNIDLTHRDFDERVVDQLWERSHTVTLGQCSIRVLAAEDHLRSLCGHLLRHGAWRPLWLCDIAAVLESGLGRLDWKLCLGRGRRQAEWVTAAVGLAHHLLGAPIDDVPVTRASRQPPAWLLSATLKQWEKPTYVDHPLPEPLSASLRTPQSLRRALRSRWPDPIEATAVTGAPFNDWPRLIFQLGCCAQRATAYFLRLLKPVPDKFDAAGGDLLN